ncbi:MAG: hypothetical protein ACEPOV_13080 [Hyphomicrobiales bacterium]
MRKLKANIIPALFAILCIAAITSCDQSVNTNKKSPDTTVKGTDKKNYSYNAHIEDKKIVETSDGIILFFNTSSDNKVYNNVITMSPVDRIAIPEINSFLNRKDIDINYNHRSMIFTSEGDFFELITNNSEETFKNRPETGNMIASVSLKQLSFIQNNKYMPTDGNKTDLSIKDYLNSVIVK